MANRLKDTVEFFPFFVADGKTLYVLQRKYGLAGIGFFTQIMRWLSRTPGHYYSYVDDYDKDRLNEFIGMSETDVKAYIDDMVKTGKLDKALWEERNVIYSQDYVDTLEEVYKRRKTERPSREWVLEQTDAICMQYADNMSDTAPQYVEQSRGSKVEEGEESAPAKRADTKHPKTGAPMNQTTYHALLASYDTATVDDYFERVADYCNAKGEKYKDHAATVRNWMKRDNVPKKRKHTGPPIDVSKLGGGAA